MNRHFVIFTLNANITYKLNMYLTGKNTQFTTCKTPGLIRLQLCGCIIGSAYNIHKYMPYATFINCLQSAVDKYLIGFM